MRLRQNPSVTSDTVSSCLVRTALVGVGCFAAASVHVYLRLNRHHAAERVFLMKRVCLSCLTASCAGGNTHVGSSDHVGHVTVCASPDDALKSESVVMVHSAGVAPLAYMFL